MGGRRQSAMPAPPGGRRQSTVPGHRGASMAYNGRRTDPRPTTDRVYQQQCVQAIVTFVCENGYTMPITPKILTNPTTKDFQNIFLFMMRYLDASFKFEKRFDDEMPAVMKSLGYPFTISKSSLSAIGSPHAWPTLLGVLTWLLNLIRCDMAKSLNDEQPSQRSYVTGGNIDCEEQEQGEVPRDKENEMLVQNTIAAYREFLTGSDVFPELDEEMRKTFEDENIETREDISRLKIRIIEQSQKLDFLHSQPSPLVRLNEHTKSLRDNIDKFNVLNPKLVEHRAFVEGKLIEKHSESEALQIVIRGMSEEIASLKTVITRQQENAIDVEKIAKDRANLKEALSKLKEERTAAETDLNACNDRLSLETTAVTDGLRRYHKGAGSLLFIPGTAKNASGVDFRINVLAADESSPQQQLLSIDVSESVIPALREQKDAFSQRHSALRSEDLALQDKLDADEDLLIMNRDNHKKQETRLAKFDREYKAEKAAMADQLKTTSEQALMREEEISERRRCAEESVRESERTIENLVSQLRSFEENFASERYRFGTLVMQHCRRMHEHNSSIQDSTQIVVRHFNEEFQNVDEQDITVGAEGPDA
jgi:kinetochore protein NDC80